ncbi:MAG: amidohydrolase family protein [Clostridia bacterium]|nr:amidohydrolase family protein [Clostridia bacterium]
MMIDFHTHVFPDKIAERTVALLAKQGGFPTFSNGFVSGLLEKMEEADVDLSVNLPVMTSPSQFDSLNRFAAELNQTFADKERRIISFAGIHPMCEDLEAKMKWIKEQGFLGVKIHPDYQDTYINAEPYVRILRAAKEEDLIVVTHAGVDDGYPHSPVHCTPERTMDLIRKVRHSKFVLAHYGGNRMPEDVFDILAGEDVYFDTAYLLRFLKKEDFLRILEKHGDDRILFASDSPWSDIRGDIEIIRSYALPTSTEQKILSENAKKLLGLN